MLVSKAGRFVALTCIGRLSDLVPNADNFRWLRVNFRAFTIDMSLVSLETRRDLVWPDPAEVTVEARVISIGNSAET
jgi:hypothetical protein